MFLLFNIIMAKDKLEYIFKEFWKDNFNKALLISAIGFSILSFIFIWITPITMLLWFPILFRLPDFREYYPNKFYLLFFLIVAIIWNQFDSNFMFAILLLGGLLFVPEDKWDIFNRSKK